MTHTPQKWKKKPVVIEAMQYDGTPESFNAIMEWSRPIIGSDAIGSSGLNIRISTLEGTMTASEGDWIIRGVKDEFYPCKPDIFERTYEPATTLDLADELASLRAEVGILRRYAGSNLIRSDFRTADEMRAAYDRLRAENERLRKALETIRDEHASDGHFWMCECDGGRWTCDTWLEANAALNPPPKEQP